MIEDAVGLPLHIGDLVFDIRFGSKMIILRFQDDGVIAHYPKLKSLEMFKMGYSLVSLEPHLQTNPELFL